MTDRTPPPTARELEPYSASPPRMPASLIAAFTVCCLGMAGLLVYVALDQPLAKRAAAAPAVAPLPADCPTPTREGDRTVLIVRRTGERLVVTCHPVPVPPGDIQPKPEKSMMNAPAAPPPRIPLLAPPEARVFDIATQARAEGLRLVWTRTGLALVPYVRPGQFPVGEAA